MIKDAASASCSMHSIKSVRKCRAVFLGHVAVVAAQIVQHFAASKDGSVCHAFVFLSRLPMMMINLPPPVVERVVRVQFLCLSRAYIYDEILKRVNPSGTIWHPTKQFSASASNFSFP